jgi:hypothetical protein
MGADADSEKSAQTGYDLTACSRGISCIGTLPEVSKFVSKVATIWPQGFLRIYRFIL